MADDPLVVPNRYLRLAEGEERLRSHLAPLAPLKFSLNFIPSDGKGWVVRTTLHPEGHGVLDLSTEPLDIFPSDQLIATAMLAAG